MDGRSNKGPDLTKQPTESLPKSNKSVPRGLLFRELGFKQKENSVSAEFQRAAEDRLVLKNHEELPCEFPDVSRSTFLMVFSPDGTKVASTHGNHNVYVTDLNTGKNVNTLSGHPRTPWCIAFHPSSNQILASGCLGGQVRVWDLHGGSEIWTAESQTVIASLAFHPTDRMLVIATYNELHFWDWSQPIPFTKCFTSNEKEKVRYVAFDPLGHKLITGISNAPHNQTQWDRVATPSRQGSTLASSSHSSAPRTNSMLPPEQERRITFCYRSLVEQYEQLVQRYYDLSRSRTTPTMDRGTDPMDLSESSSGTRSGTAGTQAQTQTSTLRSRINLLRESASGNSNVSSSNSSSSSSSSSTSSSSSSISSLSGGSSSASSSTSSCTSLSGHSSEGSRNDSNNTDNASRPGSNDRPLRNIPSVVLMHNLMRRLDQEVLSNTQRRSDSRASDHSSNSDTTQTQTASQPRRLSSIGIELRGRTQESGEQNVVGDRTVPLSRIPTPTSMCGPTGVARQVLDEDRQTTPDSTTRDASASTTVAAATTTTTTTTTTTSSSSPYLFSRLHSQAHPSAPSPPERPRRFFISQRSAFQPRVPRGYTDQAHPESRSNMRSSSSPANQNPRRYFLQRRLAGSYFSQSLQDDESNEDSTQNESLPSRQNLDSTSDVGVRYGIQLLSRHIDNMQRLCRARLEILQLQQIRRMWEDLQRQIRSLHVAVRESTFALTDSPDAPTSRGRRRFRLYSHPREDSGLGMSSDLPFNRRNMWRSEESDAASTEQGGSHIPSVSQMLELARISDIGPSTGNDQTNVPADSGANASNEEPSTSSEQPTTSSKQPNASREQSSSQSAIRKGTLARLHAQFAALTRLKFVVDKTNGARKEGESSRSNAGEASRNASAEGGGDVASTGDNRDRLNTSASDAEPSVSQSANLDSCKKPVAGSSSQQTNVPGPTENPVSNRTVEPPCENSVIKIKRCDKCHPDDQNELGSPSKRKRGEDMPENSVLPHESSSNSIAIQDSPTNSSTTSSIPTVLTTTTTTTTTVTSSVRQPGNSDTKSSPGPTDQSSETSSNVNSWSGYSHDGSPAVSPPTTTQATAFTSSPTSASSNPHHRLWRISRRVYLRRPRFLALGPRSRTMALQLQSHRRYQQIFRHYECRRPWFMQSLTNQNYRTSLRGISTAAQVDAREAPHLSGSEGSESNGNTSSNSSINQTNNTVRLSSNVPTDVPTSDQSSCPSEETPNQSVNKSVPGTSSQTDDKPGPSRGEQEKSASSRSEQLSDAEPHSKKRKAEDCPDEPSLDDVRLTEDSSDSEDQSNAPQPRATPQQRDQTTSESLRAMIARLESLVRQQREQREAARQEMSQESSAGRGGRRTNMWGLRERPLWFRGDGNSGSDSDSNPESDRQQRWGRHNIDERLITALENELNSGFTSGTRRGRAGPLDEDWEWTRESTRLRARQVLSLMVESLTQFFEENGLSNNTSHAVLDEQIYNLYILLQLALELTDLLLAQLVSTRRELEHQWVHHVRSPVALYDSDMTATERGIEERLIHPRRRRSPPRDGEGSNVSSEERGERDLEDSGFQGRRGRGRSPSQGRDDFAAAIAAERGFVEEYYLSRRRGRPPSRDERESRRFHARPLLPDQPDFFRLSRFRRLLRYTNNSLNESLSPRYNLESSNTCTTGRSSPNIGVNRGESTRRLGPRVVNCYSRYGTHSSLGTGGRMGRGSSSRPLVRGSMTRRDGTGIRLPSYSRDGGIRIPPYSRVAGIRLPGGINVPTLAENSSPNAPVRSPHIVVRVQNPIPTSSANASQQNNPEQPRSVEQTPPSQQQPPPPPQQQQQQQQQQQSASRQQQDAFTVPLVRVNDVLIPDTSLLNQPQPRQRPQSPPPHPSPNLRNPFIQHQQQQSQQPQSPLRYLGNPSADVWRYPGSPAEVNWRSGWRPRFLHPRYMAPNPFSDDNEEPLLGSALENINFIRDSFIITDAPMSPNHRIQAWDFSKLNIPDISNAEKNVIVAECKIHNDASVDVSNDGRLLVTLLPTGRLSSTAMLGVYSLEWESLGQCLYTTSFEQNAVSVSLSPASRHLLVGLASRRVALLPSDRHTMAQIFRLEGGVPGRTVGARGRLCHLRDIEQDREQGYMSLNCIRWAPGPGQGLVYGTNTGKLRVLR